MTRIGRLCCLLFAAGVPAILAPPAWAEPLTPEIARTQTAEAFTLLYPSLGIYRIIYTAAVDEKSLEWQAPFNRFSHQARLVWPATPTARANTDVLVSSAALDLRREPLVLSVPALPRERYFSFHLVDLGARSFGRLDSAGESQSARNYLVAGPGWKGRTPKGIEEVFRATANFALITGRTAVNGAGDLSAASGVIRQYTLTPLSAFQKRKAPPVPPRLNFPPYDAARAGSAAFVVYANFLLGQSAIPPEQKSLLGRFRALGLYPGRHFDPERLEPDIRRAMDEGVAAAHARIDAEVPRLSPHRNGWSLTGSALAQPEAPRDAPLIRAAAAAIGLWDESLAVIYASDGIADDKGDPLNAFRHNYTLRFAADQLPPVDGFWSVTAYALPGERLVANTMDRYSVGSRSPGLKYDKDGSLTLYIQYKPPAGEREANWLPAPNGLFSLTLRMYSPKPESLSPPYAPPPVRRP